MASWPLEDRYLVPGSLGDGQRYRQARSSDLARAWARAGVGREVWAHHPSGAFRRGWKSGLLALGAQPDSVDYLQGHALGGGGSRERYIDAWRGLPLVETAALVPQIANDVGIRDHVG